MTYCVGIEVDEGLVFAADTRTNASLDDVRVHRKLHVFEYPGQAAYVLMAAGNLATTQLLVSRLGRDAGERRTPNLRDMTHLFEAAEYVGGEATVKYFRLTDDGKPYLPVTVATFKGKRDL